MHRHPGDRVHADAGSRAPTGDGYCKRDAVLLAVTVRSVRVGSSACGLFSRDGWVERADSPASCPHPLSWQHAARPQTFAPVSRGTTVPSRSPPQRLQRCKRFCISLCKQRHSSRWHPSSRSARPRGTAARDAGGRWKRPCEFPILKPSKEAVRQARGVWRKLGYPGK